MLPLDSNYQWLLPEVEFWGIFIGLNCPKTIGRVAKETKVINITFSDIAKNDVVKTRWMSQMI